MTIGEDAILRRAEELDALDAILPFDRRDQLAALLTDDDVATLTRLAGEGMGSLIVFRRLIWPSACC
ncbi:MULTISPECIES: hypothetical protein [Sinorhizobium]|uniref:hypothetical protein n=1 Tax=Sinorhizobium TaxID=28105 RepID=UPI00059AFC0E|nr:MULTISPECIES: hypothetical protein [Sinorhizobium]